MKKVNEILMDLCFLETEPKKENTLKEDLGIDSLRIVELIVQTEEAYGLQFDISELNPEKLITVGDLYDLLQRYRAI